MAKTESSFGKDEIGDWELTKELNSVAAFKRFMAAYPNSKTLPIAQSIYEALKEEKDWQTARKRDKIFAYEKYLESYPSGKYSDQAGKRLELLEHDLVWEEALKENSISSYLNYRRIYPEGLHLEEAEQRVSSLAKKEDFSTPFPDSKKQNNNPEEEKALELATVKDSVTAYNLFLKEFPNGHYVPQVKKRIRQLETKLAKQYRVIEEELQAWEYADRQNSRFAYRDFVRKFPKGRFTELAKERMAQLESRLVIKVKSNTGRPITSKNIINKTDPEAQKLEIDQQERDMMAYRLSWMWMFGFIILSLLTYFLAKFLYPIGLVSSFLVGGYFVFHRGKHITPKETFVYRLGAGLASSFLLFEIINFFVANQYFAISIAAIGGLLVIVLLRPYFNRQDNQT